MRAHKPYKYQFLYTYYAWFTIGYRLVYSQWNCSFNVLSYPNSLQITVGVLKAKPFHLETLKSTNNN